jgi:hypothetical protein
MRNGSELKPVPSNWIDVLNDEVNCNGYVPAIPFFNRKVPSEMVGGTNEKESLPAPLRSKVDENERRQTNE